MKNLRMAIWMVAGGLLLLRRRFRRVIKPWSGTRRWVTDLPRGMASARRISQQDLTSR